MKENDIVVPGERLAAEEEYAHGTNTYVEENGIYASMLGRVAIKNGTIGVMPIGRELHEIDRGMLVLGNVSDYMKSVIFVKLQNIKSDGKEFLALKDGKIPIPRPRPGFGGGRPDFRSHGFSRDGAGRGGRPEFAPRDRQRGYGHSEPHEPEEKQCKVGDTILAMVAFNDKDAYTLDMRAPEAGVVHSNCELCGGEMASMGAGVLECPLCKHRERRKVSSYYDKPDEIRKIFA